MAFRPASADRARPEEPGGLVRQLSSSLLTGQDSRSKQRITEEQKETMASVKQAAKDKLEADKKSVLKGGKTRRIKKQLKKRKTMKQKKLSKRMTRKQR